LSRLLRGSSLAVSRANSLKSDRADCQIEGVPRPWSSELAAALRRDREELLVAFVILRAQLRDAAPEEFEGGEEERMRLLQETEHDYAALVSAGAEAAKLETTLERADREATERETDLAALLIRQLRELVAAVAARRRPGG
jgi:hypothetical protein